MQQSCVVATCTFLLCGCGGGGFLSMPEVGDGAESDRRTQKGDWLQYGEAGELCIKKERAEEVASEEGCQQLANQNGHIFYIFHKWRKECATATFCKDEDGFYKGGKRWKSYRKASIWQQRGGSGEQCWPAHFHGDITTMQSQEECQIAAKDLGLDRYMFHVENRECGLCIAGPTTKSTGWRVFESSCAENPCQNGGTCTTGDGIAFACQCQAGFVGSLCDTPDPCLADPCKNGGTCVNVDTTFTCECFSGYTGDECESEHVPQITEVDCGTTIQNAWPLDTGTYLGLNDCRNNPWKCALGEADAESPEFPDDFEININSVRTGFLKMVGKGNCIKDCEELDNCAIVLEDKGGNVCFLHSHLTQWRLQPELYTVPKPPVERFSVTRVCTP